jgi:hypothetical protein
LQEGKADISRYDAEAVPYEAEYGRECSKYHQGRDKKGYQEGSDRRDKGNFPEREEDEGSRE